MALFNRSHANAYYSVIVSHHVPFSRHFTLKNIVTLKSRSLALRICARSVHRWIPQTRWQHGSIFTPFLHTESRKKLYRVKWCVTVVQGHSRSSKLVPTKSPHATSYYSSIVTIWLSSVVSEILFQGENGVSIQSRLKPSQGGSHGT